MSALSYRAVRFAFPDAARPALDGVDLEVEAGEVLLVVGASGSGKSTLLRSANGLVPHATGGAFGGDVIAFGRSTRAHRPRDFAGVIGFVHQDPDAQFVVDEVEADVAFVLENLGVDETAMRRRVEEALDALAVAHLRDRSPSTLSGGERQRCAIAGALAAAPQALVLDEPTAQLDPQGADDVIAALARLNSDLGTTVVLAEHRLERVAPAADRAVVLDSGRLSGEPGPPGAVLGGYPGAPPVTHLGRLLGWDPPPLTVRDARRRAYSGPDPTLTRMCAAAGTAGPTPTPAPAAAAPGAPLRALHGVTVTLGGRPALRDAHLDVAEGEVIAVLGRNGAGKTTLLRALAGLLRPDTGSVHGPAAAAYVPQDPDALLGAPTVTREVERTLALLDRHGPGARDAVIGWIRALGLDGVADRHPRSLSGGERQRVAIAAVAVGGAPVLLLDEPTRGMDAPSRRALEAAIRAHAGGGGAVLLATHDVELAARCATRVVVLADGDVVADGPARPVLSGSLFAPQVLRVAPPFLTVADVEHALGPRPSAGARP